jgi:ribosomal protein S18 acetylase RimI-like enzyme
MTEIRPFERGDVDFALRQKTREGWAVSRERFEVFLEHDPDGCFVAVDCDQPVGMVTTVCFGQSGWIGNLIVEPRCRSRGIGRALMEHGLDHLRARGTTTVRLEGDPPGIPLYRKLGFVNEFESCRFTLRASSVISTLGDALVETMIPGDLDEVAALDAEAFGADRRRYLELLLSCAEIAVVRRRNGRIAAWLLASPTDLGLRAGPCVAVGQDEARCLIAAAVSAAAGRPVLIGVPAPNTEALDLFAEIGFEQGASSLRMRFGPAIAVGDAARVFAISSGAAG